MWCVLIRHFGHWLKIYSASVCLICLPKERDTQSHSQPNELAGLAACFLMWCFTNKSKIFLFFRAFWVCCWHTYTCIYRFFFCNLLNSNLISNDIFVDRIDCISYQSNVGEEKYTWLNGNVMAFKPEKRREKKILTRTSQLKICNESECNKQKS